MSRAALAPPVESTSASKSKSSPASLRVSDPSDVYEAEAERVAETVSKGGRIPGWSLSSSGFGTIQRDPAPGAASSAAAAKPAATQLPDSTAPDVVSNADLGPKLAEAFIGTPTGKQLLQMLQGDPLVHGATDFVTTPAGIVVAGSTALGAVTALAATHKSLPLQIPKIPLDKFVPGMSVKIDYEGPLDHPTQASLVVSFEGGEPKSKKDKSAPSASERYRAQTKRIAKRLELGTETGFGAKPGPLPADQQRLADADSQRRLTGIHDPKPFALLDRSLALKTQAQVQGTTNVPAAVVPQTPKIPAGTDELRVQRKAESAGAFSVNPDAVRGTLSSSGRPLDAETRRYMESRIGFDFSKVRLHTDASAAASARALNARAYTVGNDVVFSTGSYAPQTIQGKRLLAHELTHVVQQSGAAREAHPIARTAPRQVQRAIDLPDSVKEKLESYLKRIPGYQLLTVLLGKNPVTGQIVERNATNLAEGVLDLVPGGKDAFKRLQETNAIERTALWIQNEVAKLQFTEDYFLGLLQQAKDSLSWRDIANLEGAAARVVALFKPSFDRLISFARAVFDKVFEFVVDAAMEALGGQAILEVLHKASAAFGTIAKDPAAFLRHLLDALKKGFAQFSGNIVEHLKKGLMEWLFGEVAKSGITIPKTFDTGSIVNLVLQILGLTWAKFKARLVDALGEKAVSVLEKTFDVVKALAGPAGMSTAWKMILENAGNLFETIASKVKDWVVEKIVTLAVTHLAALFNPVGGIIESIRVIYETIKFLLDKAKQIAAVIKTVVNSVSEIASGNIDRAADWIETSLSGTIPLVLRFMAGLIGLGGIGDTIRDIIKAVQAKVDGAIDKVFKIVLEKGRALLDKGKDVLASAVEWWQQKKKLVWGGAEHTLSIEGSEDAPRVMIASSPGVPWSEYLGKQAAPTDPAQKALLEDTKKLAENLEKRLPPSKDDSAKAKAVEERRTWFDTLAANLEKLGFTDASAGNLPASKIEYEQSARPDGGATMATASVLSKNHPEGSEVSDAAPIWTKLGSLTGKKNYVQGHLLNNNLGGEGRRFNLTPISKSANAKHLAQVERSIKRWVNTENKVVSYKVVAVYDGTHKKPSGYQELLKLQTTTTLTDDQKTQLAEFEAEQQLVTRFDYEAQQLVASGTSWVPVKDDPANKEATSLKGQVNHEIAN